MVEMPEIKWVVTIGAIFALCTSMLGAMFPLPRVLYAMGNDGIIFRVFSKISPKTQTPILATFVSGILAGTFLSILFLLMLCFMQGSIDTIMSRVLSISAERDHLSPEAVNSRASEFFTLYFDTFPVQICLW